MRVEEIEKLLAKYYEGNTDEIQEEALKKYFKLEDIPEHLEKDKKLFLTFCEDKVIAIPVGLEDRLKRTIDNKEAEEKRFFRRNKNKRNWRWVGGIAASILLLFGVGYGLMNIRDEGEKPKDTFTDPQKAYEVLHATLLEVSCGLNEGINEISESQKEINQVNKEIQKELQQ